MLYCTAQSDPDRKDDKDEGLTKRDIIRVLGEGRYSDAAVSVLSPVNMCDVEHTPKHRRADGTIAQQSRRAHTPFAC